MGLQTPNGQHDRECQGRFLLGVNGVLPNSSISFSSATLGNEMRLSLPLPTSGNIKFSAWEIDFLYGQLLARMSAHDIHIERWRLVQAVIETFYQRLRLNLG